jgi:hypothetical protein
VPAFTAALNRVPFGYRLEGKNLGNDCGCASSGLLERVGALMTRRKKVVGCLAVLVIAVLAMWIVPREPPEAYEFPAASDIVSMEAELFTEENESKFMVPSELYDDILAALSPSQLDPNPAKWVVLGSLEIRTVDGKSISVDLFDLHDDPVGAFKAGLTPEPRKYYRGGNSARLKRALAKAVASPAP